MPPTHPEPVQSFGEGTKKPCAYRDSNPGPTCSSPNRYTNRGIPALNLRNTTIIKIVFKISPAVLQLRHNTAQTSPWFNFKDSGLLRRDAASFGERHDAKTGILNCIAV
jgi:hypothetical protein